MPEKDKRKRIAMINCLRANTVCAGAACFKAWNEKKRSFERYRDAETELVAFMRCNGCDADPDTDAGMKEKIERLISIGTDVVHFGVCTKDESGACCPLIRRVQEILQQAGVECVEGTH